MATKKSDSTSSLDDKAGTLTAEQKKMLKEAATKEKPLEYIETGDIGLDLALTDGLGLPMGASALFWAKPGSGKTTVIADAAKRMIEKAKEKGEVFKVLYLAVEDSDGLIRSLGLSPYLGKEFLYIAKRLCWRHVEYLYELVLKNEKPYDGVKLIIIDSINNVQSDQNMKNSVADGDYGTKARERSNFYGKFLPICKEKGVSSFFISQIRRKQNVGMFEDPNRAAVSDVDLHNVDIIFKCTASSNSTDASRIEEKTIFGTDKVASKCIFKMDSKATDCKNRYITGNAVELLFEKGKGVHNYYTLGKLLEGNGLVKSSAGWWEINPEICDTFGLPKNKMRKDEFNKILTEHETELVEVLKRMGIYKVGISSVEVPVTEEEVQEEASKEE